MEEAQRGEGAQGSLLGSGHRHSELLHRGAGPGLPEEEGRLGCNRKQLSRCLRLSLTPCQMQTLHHLVLEKDLWMLPSPQYLWAVGMLILERDPSGAERALEA